MWCQTQKRYQHTTSRENELFYSLYGSVMIRVDDQRRKKIHRAEWQSGRNNTDDFKRDGNTKQCLIPHWDKKT